jgi:hypothetical protein
MSLRRVGALPGAVERWSGADLCGTSLAEQHRDVLAEAGVVGAEPGVVGQQGFDALLPGLVAAALRCRERAAGGRGWRSAEPLDLGAGPGWRYSQARDTLAAAATPRKVIGSLARSRSRRASRVRVSAASLRRRADCTR